MKTFAVSVSTLLAAVFGLCSLSFEGGRIGFAAAAAQQVTELSLVDKWDPSADPSVYATPKGTVVVAQRDGLNKLFLTFILQGAQLDHDYAVAFDIYVEDPNVSCDHVYDNGVSATPATFGTPFGGTTALNRAVCSTPVPGLIGGVYGSAGGYILGKVTTDGDGDGSLHVGLADVPPGTYRMSFWAADCYPASQCGYRPEFATRWWGYYHTITIPNPNP